MQSLNIISKILYGTLTLVKYLTGKSVKFFHDDLQGIDNLGYIIDYYLTSGYDSRAIKGIRGKRGLGGVGISLPCTFHLRKEKSKKIYIYYL